MLSAITYDIPPIPVVVFNIKLNVKELKLSVSLDQVFKKVMTYTREEFPEKNASHRVLYLHEGHPFELSGESEFETSGI